MLEMVQFVSTYRLSPEDDVKNSVQEIKKHYDYGIENINGQDFIDIETILLITDKGKDKISWYKKIPEAIAKPHRDAIKATFKAFLNGDSSMITDLRPKYPSWAEQTASAVQNELTDAVQPRPMKQKKRAMMDTLPLMETETPAEEALSSASTTNASLMEVLHMRVYYMFFST
jgi:hypothetical protein